MLSFLSVLCLYIFLYQNIAIASPIILAIFILNIQLNDIFNILKSKTKGVESPNSCPYPNHQSQDTLLANSPSNPT